MDTSPRQPRRATRGRRPNRAHSYNFGPHELPVSPLRNSVLLPNTVMPLYIEQEKTRRAIDAALDREGLVLVVAQSHEMVEVPDPSDLYLMGVEAQVERTFIGPDPAYSVMIRALRRARVVRYTDYAMYLTAEIEPIAEIEDASPLALARMRIVREHFELASKATGRYMEEAVSTVMGISDPGALADAVSMTLDLSLHARQSILETLTIPERLELVDGLVLKEMQVQQIESKLQQNVQVEMDRSQKEYYLREQIKIIQKELAEHDPGLRDGMDLRERIETAGMPDEVRTRALREMERLDAMNTMAPEYTVLRTYVDWLLALPWTTATTDRIDLDDAQRILDNHHFGLTKAKERLIEFLAVRKLAPASRSPILCFVGPPGVGKTSLGRSIAEALGRKFMRVSLGGVRDEAEIRDHRRTYVGAMPGRILQTMRQAGTVNPLFVLDEIDKLASDYRGDPAAALLEVLDPEQNSTFSDHYLEVPYDLSKIIFILTANTLQTVPPALLDRMEVIELPGYTEEEKLHIAQKFLVPRQLTDHGLTPARLEFRDDALRHIIRDYTYEAGVRNLERELSGVMRKVARRVVEGKRAKVSITPPRVSGYLGPQKAFGHEAETLDQIGVAMGVAWTAAGGDLTPIEIAILEGKGSLQLTGQLGEVLRESAQAAISYTRGRVRELGISPTFYEKNDIHMHLAMGGVKKDGPSAGVPIAVALISALSGRAVRHDTAMTGEITLRGRVLPVGGLKEKAYAAYRAGLKQFLLPRKNLHDLDDLPSEITDALRLIPVDSLDDVLPLVLAAPPRCTEATEHDAPNTTPPAARATDDAPRVVDKPNPVTPHEPQRPLVVGLN